MQVELKQTLTAAQEDAWNRRLLALPNAHPFQALYARVLWPQSKAFHYLLAYEGERLEAAALIREHSVAGLLKRWTIFRGPLCATPEDLRSILPPLFEHAESQGVMSVTLSPYFENTEAIQAESVLEECGARLCAIQGGHTQSVTVDLRLDEQEILRGFNDNTRRQIRKAEELAIDVAPPRSDDEARAFVAIYQRMSEERGADPLREEYLLRFRDLTLASLDPHGVFLLARYDGKIVAGILLLHNHEQSWYIHGASDFSYRQIPLTFLLHWRAMQLLKARRIERYNFGGLESLDDERKAIRGISQFKLGFSKTVVTCTHEYERILSPLTSATDRALRTVGRALRKR